MALNQNQCRLLTSSFLLQGVDIPAKDAFFQRLAVNRFSPGEDIYTAERFQSCLGFIAKGQVTVYNPHGVVLNRLSAGECFGAAALFHPVKEYVTTVQAKTMAEIIFISDQQLTGLFLRYPKAAINYISFLSGRIAFLNRRIDSFTVPTTLAGVALYLARNSQDGAVMLPFGYSDLARRLNMGRASLYRSLDQLEQEGAIRRCEKVIYILNPSRLSQYER